MKKYSILLTATVNPEGMIFTERNDPKKRLEDYVMVIKSLNKLGYKNIVFCENTSLKIEELSEKIDIKDIEFLSFNGNNYNKSLGKGYGEAKIIDYAFKNSNKLRESEFTLKITGRYDILNIVQLTKYFERSKSDIIADFRKNLSYTDSRVFFAHKSFFTDYFLSFSEEINDNEGVYFEHMLARSIHAAMSNGMTFENLSIVPNISGFSGTTNTRVTNPIKIPFKTLLQIIKGKIFKL